MKKYICAFCGEECESDLPDEVAMAESEAIFGAAPEGGLAVICDDCWEMMNREDPWLREQSSKFKTPN